MKIAVCIKQVPATTAHIRVKDSGEGLDLSGVEMVMNPYDELALEQALVVKEAVPGSEIIAISVGGSNASKTLTQAYALGVDEAILIELEDADAGAAAHCVASYLKSITPDLVFCGRQAIDDDQWFFPAALGEALDLPHVTAISQFELSEDGSTATCNRQVDGGEEVLEVTLPAVISCNKGLNEPRSPTLKGRLAAKKKTVETKSPSEVGAVEEQLASRLMIDLFEPPPEKSPGKMITAGPVEAAEELVQLLRNEAKVI